jgi:DNA-directed RNA polymerase specialized sigma subunit
MVKDNNQEYMDSLKEDLRSYHSIVKNLETLENMLKDIDNKLYKVGGFNAAERVQATKEPDKWSELISAKIKLQDAINKKLIEGYEEIARIESLINGLDEEGKLMMRLKYIECLTWPEVAVRMKYSWRHMHRKHSQYLKDVIECHYNTKI